MSQRENFVANDSRSTRTSAVILRRVSTEEQGDSRNGLDAQLHTCEQEIARRGWDSVAVFTEVVSGFSVPMHKRSGLMQAIDLCRTSGHILVCAKGDRLSRRLTERLELMEVSHKEGWAVFLCDLPEADPTTAAGWMMQTMMGMLAEYERRIISERTRDAMAALIRRGKHVGRPREVDPAAVSYATYLREDGRNWTEIALALDDAGFAPPRAATWDRRTVRHMVTGESWGRVTKQIQREDSVV
jgi:DNA invertase Pin-like site-specific DNA recombinase